MRDIKFRVWLVEEKRMVSSLVLGDEGLQGFIYNERCEVMQYTGLKDKNGNEIYESDIVEIEYYPGLPTTIKLQNLTLRAVCKYSEIHANFYLWSETSEGFTNIYSVGFDGSAVKRKEVVGNTYENPELLE